MIEFGASAEAAPVLAAMKRMPALLRSRRKPTVAEIDETLVQGSWKRLVFGSPPPADGAIDQNAYVFCILTQFHRHLRRRDIYAEASARWRDPRAQLLDGEAWANAKGPVLTALSLPEDPDRVQVVVSEALGAKVFALRSWHLTPRRRWLRVRPSVQAWQVGSPR